MKIYAPVKDFNGWRNTVRFVNGVGETDNQSAIQWFLTHGYRIEEKPIEVDCLEVALKNCVEPVENPLEKCDEPDFEAMTPNELRDWAKANGLGSVIKNTRNKEKLLELIRG